MHKADNHVNYISAQLYVTIKITINFLLRKKLVIVTQGREKLDLHFQKDKINVFAFGFMDGNNGFENKIKRSLTLNSFLSCCFVAPVQYYTTPCFQEVQFHTEYLA